MRLRGISCVFEWGNQQVMFALPGNSGWFAGNRPNDIFLRAVILLSIVYHSLLSGCNRSEKFRRLFRSDLCHGLSRLSFQAYADTLTKAPPVAGSRPINTIWREGPFRFAGSQFLDHSCSISPIKAGQESAIALCVVSIA